MRAMDSGRPDEDQTRPQAPPPLRAGVYRRHRLGLAGFRAGFSSPIPGGIYVQEAADVEADGASGA